MGSPVGFSYGSPYATTTSTPPSEQDKQKQYAKTAETLNLVAVSIAVSGVALCLIGLFASSPIAFALGALTAMLGHDGYRLVETIWDTDKSKSLTVKPSPTDELTHLLKRTLILSKLPRTIQKKIFGDLFNSKEPAKT